MKPSDGPNGTKVQDSLFNESQLNAVSDTGALQPAAAASLEGDNYASMASEEAAMKQRFEAASGIKARNRTLKFAVLGAVLVIGLALVGIRQLHSSNTGNPSATADASLRYHNVSIPLADLATGSSALSVQKAQSLSINGQLNVNNSLVLAPTAQPAGAVTGQLYFDQTSKQLAYYNGTAFVSLNQNTPAPQGVSSLGNATGAVALGGGLSVNTGTLSNTGVLTLQGQAGNITLAAGPGIVVNGTTVSNSGLLSLGGQGGDILVGSGLSISGGTLRNSGILSAVGAGLITVTNDGNGNITIDGPSGSGGGTVSSPGGTLNKITKFTGVQTIADSLLSDNGTVVTVGGDLSVTGTVSLTNALPVTSGGTGANTASGARTNLGAAKSGANSDITSLSGLTTALTVAQGGIGVGTLATNGVILGNGTSPLSSVVAGSAGQCLVSTAGAPIWATCPGSGGVSSLNGGTGALTLNNASLAGSNITINDATTAAKGIASFSATNFLVTSGAVNTIQNINATAAPTFGQLTLTSSQAANPMFVVNNTNLAASGALLDLQLNGASKFSVSPAGNITAAGTLNGQTISSSASLTGTLAVAGAINGQTISSAANFTGSVAIGTTLSVNTVTPSSSLTIGATGQSFLLQGNSSSTLTATSGANKTTLGFQTPTANVTYNFPTAAAGTYDICTTAGNCAGVGGGVTTPGGTANTLAKFTASGTIGNSSITDNGTTVTVGGTLSVNTITPTSTLTVGATGQNLTLQGATVSLTSTASGITNALTFATPSGSNKTITLPNATGTLAVSATGPLALDAAGNLTCPTCLTSGGGGGTAGVASLNGQTGTIILQGTDAASITTVGTTITVNDASSTVKGLAKFDGTNLVVTSGAVNTAQGITVTSAPTFAGLTLTSALTVANGGTGSGTAAGARSNLGAAASGANSDITSLSGLTTALSVLQGGTGAASLTANGVLVGHGTSPVTSVTGSNGDCLQIVAGAPVFTACPGGSGGVDSLNGLLGAITLNNASGSLNSITIDDAKADGSTKGIAAFNGTNFTDNGAGVINTVQDIATTSAPTFGQLTVTSSQAANAMMVINNTNALGTGNLIDLKLNGSSKFSVAPNGNTTIAGTLSSGLINGQTISSSASFTGSVAVGTTLSVNTITPSGTLTVGATGQSFVLQGNGSSTITSRANGHTATLGFTGGSPTTDPLYQLDSSAATGTYTICTTAANCVGVGGGVSGSGTSNRIAKYTATGTIIGNSSIVDNGSSVTLDSNVSLILQGTTASISNSHGGSNAEAFGLNANIQGGHDNLAVGTNASTDTYGVALGPNATSQNAGVAIGSSAQATGDGALAIGKNSSSTFTGSIILGVDGATTAANQFVVGSSSHAVTQAVIGNGVAAASPVGFTLQATSTLNGTSNTAGASITIASGQGTGTGSGGNINFQVAKGTTNGASQNALATVATISGTDGSALFKNSADSTTGFRIQNAAGTANVLTADTANSRVAINGTPTALNFEVNGTTRLGATNSVSAFAITNAGSNPVFGVDTSANQVYLNPIQNATVGLQTNNSLSLVLDSNYWNGSSSVDSTYTIQNIASTTAPNYRLAFKNTSGAEVFTLNADGSAKFKDATDSSTAFQIQNAATQTLLNVNTTSALAVSAGSASSVAGVTTVGSTPNSGGQNGIITRRITTSAAGTLNGLSFYISGADNSPNNNFQVAIYSDSATCSGGATSCPNTLIASSTAGTLNGFAWNTKSLSASLAASTNYWIAIEQNASSNSLNNTVYTTTTGDHYSFYSGGTACTGGSVAYGTWPTTLGTSCTPAVNNLGTTNLSAYATVNTGSDGYAISTDNNAHVGIGTAANSTDMVAINGVGTGSGLNVTGYTSVYADSKKAFSVQSTAGVMSFEVDTSNQKIYVNSSFTGTNAASFNVHGASSSSIDILDAYNNSNVAVFQLTKEGTTNFGSSTARSGTGLVSNTAGSATVTGASTNFLSVFKVGDTMTIDPSGANVACTVAAIASDTSLTCSSTIVSAHTSVSFNFSGPGSSDIASILANGNFKLGSGNAHTIYVDTAASGNNGDQLILQGGSGNGTNKNGGNLVLQGGNSTGAGTAGAVIVKPQTDTTGAFQVQNAAGTSTVLDVDTANNRVGIGTGTPSRPLDIVTNNSTTNAPSIKLEQQGTGDTSIELKDANGKSFFVGMDQSSGGTFKIASSASANTNFTVGQTSLGGSVATGYGGEAFIYKVATGATGGTATSVTFYVTTVDGTNPHAKVALYTNDAVNGRPGNLITSSGSQTITTGYNTIPISATVSASTTYWIGVTPEGNSTSFNYVFNSGSASPTAFYAVTYAGSWPSPAGSPFATDNAKDWTLYMNVTPSGAVDSFAGIDLLSLTDTGALTLQNSANSSTAFQIQNSSGTSIFNVDTTNQRISIGTGGTAVGQLYLPGTVPSSTLGSVSTTEQGTSIVTQGRYAYVLTSSKLRIFDVSRPNAMTSLGSVSVAGNGNLVVRGKYAYVTSRGSNVYAIDISNPSSPSIVSTTSIGGTLQDMYVQGRYMFVLTTSGVSAYDMANPASPRFIATLSLAGVTPQYVTGQGKYIYVTSDTKFFVIDVSNPASMTQAGFLATTQTYELTAQGRYVYIGSNGGAEIRTIDVSNPASPTSVGTVTTNTNFPVANQRYLYTGLGFGSNSYRIIDISNPASMSIVGTVSTPGAVYGTAQLGRYLYALDWSNSNLLSYDLGGEYAQSLEAGNIETGNATVSSQLTVAGNASFQGSASFGSSVNVNGDLGVNGTTTITASSSTVSSQVLQLLQAGSGDVGIQLTNTVGSYYTGVDATDNTFRISSSSATNSGTLGFTSVGATADNGDSNAYDGSKFTAGATGVINTVYIYIGTVGASPNNKAQAAIYSDSAGTPGTRLGFSSVDTVLIPNSWNAIPISAVNVTSGTSYWIMENSNGVGANDNNLYFSPGSAGQSKWSTGQTYGTWASTWPGTTNSAANQDSMYAPIIGSSSDNLSGGFLQIGNTGQTVLKNTTDSATAFQIQNSSGTALFAADTLNLRLYIGPSAGSTTPTLLVLGNKTSAGDPTGTNGAMYYNSSSNTFRCYQNGAWTNCIGVATADSSRQQSFYNTDFLSYNLSGTDYANAPWVGTAVSGGVNSTASLTIPASHPGVEQLRSSAGGTNTGFSYLMGSANVKLGGGESFEATFNPGTFTNVTTRLGFMDATNSTDASNGVYFEINGSGVISGKTANGGTRSVTGTTYAMSLSTWYRAKVTMNAAGTTATYAVYDDSGTQLWTDTLSTNIPTNTVSNGLVSTNSTATAATLLNLDYMAVWWSTALTR